MKRGSHGQNTIEGSHSQWIDLPGMSAIESRSKWRLNGFETVLREGGGSGGRLTKSCEALRRCANVYRLHRGCYGKFYMEGIFYTDDAREST